MERIRAFVALNIPVAVAGKVAELQRELRRAAEEAQLKLAWVPPPNLHVTLKFLGEISQETSHAVRDRLVDGLAGRSSFWLDVAGVGVFPHAKRPRVLWVGVADQGELAALAAEIDGWLDELGFAREKRPFHGHLTLGRFKQGQSAFWEPWSEHAVERCQPTEVVLYRSTLRRRGAEYTALARFPLKAVAGKSRKRAEQQRGAAASSEGEQDGD